MAKTSGIFTSREIQRDRKITCRYKIQIDQELIFQNILTYLPSQKKLENFANENHQISDHHAKGFKFDNSSLFIICRYDN